MNQKYESSVMQTIGSRGNLYSILCLRRLLAKATRTTSKVDEISPALYVLHGFVRPVGWDVNVHS